MNAEIVDYNPNKIRLSINQEIDYLKESTGINHPISAKEALINFA